LERLAPIQLKISEIRKLRLSKKTLHEALVKMAFMFAAKVFERIFQTEAIIKKLVKASAAIKSLSEKICPEANRRLAAFGLWKS
jgi:hypothetical protein